MRSIDDIFLEARQIPDAAEREAFLAYACAGDADARERVHAMLRDALEADLLFEKPSLRNAMSSPTEGPGTVIGRYKLLEKIGEGGMGVVYMAEQEQPVRRRVALKIIKLGMDTRQVVARFEAERQALALMDHPHIARVLDGGATDTGRPFFVMELVQGVPITRFCEENHLSTHERVKLFIPVCQAIQSAHQKGIIHRDLKPTNILVTLNPGGSGHPMVIDFGVAKATNQKLTEKTLFTNYATMIGTPAYMSPEQAEMSRLDIDTRSDIYSLGVLLYELLTSTTPFPEKRLRSVGYKEMQRIIMEEEPERPSTRLRQKTGVSEPARPAPRPSPLATDLDWIVMKCLEKDRARRYETANGLAMDLQRHLNNETVMARPPSNVYRFQKLIRRNKLVCVTGAMAAVALVVGTGLAAWQAVRASRERDAKEMALGQAVASQQDETRLRQQAQADAYASDILLAQQAIAANNFAFARELLDRHRPQATSEKDLRGWEWRYLWQQCTSDVLAKVWQGRSKISGLKVSPDGKWLALGQSSLSPAVSLLKFVDRTTAVLVTNIPARRATDVDVAFSPTAPLLAFSSSRYEGTRAQFTIQLRNMETGQQLFEIPIPSFCAALEFSPDGRTLLGDLLDSDQTDMKGRVLLLRIPQGQLVWACETSISRPNWGFAVDPTFRAVAIGGDRLQVIDLSTGKVRWSATNECPGAVFTRDGSRLLAAEGRPAVLHVREVSSGRLIGPPIPLPGGGLGGPMALLDDRTLLSYNNDGSMRFFDVSDPTQPRPLGRPLRGKAGEVTAQALSPGGETLLTGTEGGSVQAWDTTPPRPDQPIIALTGLFAWQFAPDGRSIVTMDPMGRVERCQGPNFQSRRPLLDIGSSLARDRDRGEFSDDGRWLAISQGGVVRVWDLEKTFLPPRVIPGMLVAHSFAARGRLLMVFDPESDSAEVWDLLTRQKVSSRSSLLPRRGTPLLALSAAGKYRLEAAVLGTEASLVELSSAQVRTWKDLGLVGISEATFSPDGRLFAVASMEGSAQVRESASGRPVTTVGWRQFPIASVGFSADASQFVTVSEQAPELTLWDLGGRELLSLPIAWGELESLSFDPPRFSADGRLLGWRSSHNELYVWRAPSWAEIEAVERSKPNQPNR